jgi:hypothetical protein
MGEINNNLNERKLIAECLKCELEAKRIEQRLKWYSMPRIVDAIVGIFLALPVVLIINATIYQPLNFAKLEVTKSQIINKNLMTEIEANKNKLERIEIENKRIKLVETIEEQKRTIQELKKISQLSEDLIEKINHRRDSQIRPTEITEIIERLKKAHESSFGQQ